MGHLDTRKSKVEDATFRPVGFESQRLECEKEYLATHRIFGTTIIRITRKAI